jgi:Antitoxin VbhA
MLKCLMAKTLVPEAPNVLEQRQRAGREAGASLRLEGLAVDAETQALLARWEAGELSDAELLKAVEAHTQTLLKQ